MTRDEQLNLKKDTLWEIHEADKLIACLERKLGKAQEAMEAIVDAMKSDRIGAAGGHLVVKNDRGGAPRRLPGLPNRADLVETVEALKKERVRRAELQDSFDRM